MQRVAGSVRHGIGAFALLVAIGPAAHAQEFSVFGGAARSSTSTTYTWAFEYEEGLGEYFAASFMWLNEGHVPDHHRDGQAVQLWARAPLMNRRFVVSAGVGPYRYFDTTVAEDGGGYSNDHGWGVVYSVRAAYYASNRWIAQLQLNHVHVQRGPDSSSVMLGVGYQLDAPGEPGPRQWAPSRTGKVTDNEVTVYIGRTVLNSDDSESALAGSIDYRRGLWKYVDLTVGYLYEGSTDLARRDGITSELWLTRAFFNDKVTLAVGTGVYYALSEREEATHQGPGAHQFSGLISISGAYRFTEHWSGRLTWNRVLTRYDRDTDVMFAGLGYRW
jgi:hypothetical protein